MKPNPQETADLVTFTKEILYGKPSSFFAVQKLTDLLENVQYSEVSVVGKLCQILVFAWLY